MKRRQLFLALALIILSARAESQIKAITYVGQNKIQCIAEDDNNIWLGTSGGIVVRHKGTGAVVANYTMVNGMPGTDVTNIIIDKKNVVWCTVRFFGLVKIEGNVISLPHRENMSNFATYTDLALDYSGNKWLLSPWEIVNFDDTKWDVYSYSALGGGVAAQMAVDNASNIWVAAYDANIYLLNTKTGVFSKIADGTSEVVLNGEYINALAFEQSTATMFFGTDNGLITCKNGVWANDPDVSNTVLDITFDINGACWMASSSGLLKKLGAVVTTYNTGDGLVDNYVNCLLIDSHEKKWAGTAKGLSRYNDLSFINFNLPDPIYPYVRAIAVDKTDRVWANSNNGLVMYDGVIWKSVGAGSLFPIGADATNNFWYHDNFTSIGYVDNGSVFHTAYTPAGGFLISYLNSADKIVYVDNSNNFVITTPSATYSHAWLSSARDIVLDKTGKYWFATANGVLCLSSGSWTVYPLPASEGANAVAVDSKGKVWAATDHNLDTLNTSSNTFVNAFYAYTSSADMCFDEYDNLWVAAMYDVHKCDGNSFLSYNASSGVSVQYGQCITIDSKGKKWMGTFSGITEISCEVPIPLFSSNEICYLNNDPSILNNETTNEDVFTKYKWDIGNNASVDYTTKNAQHNFGGYGTYPVKLTAVNDQCSADTLMDVKVSLKPDVKIVITGENPLCFGKTVLLTADIKNAGALSGFSYQWDGPGFYPDQSSIEIDEQGTYNATVTFENCISDISADFNLIVRKPYDSSKICLVTVDKESGKNKVIWERLSGKRTLSYNVYKKVGSLYVPLGGVPFDSVSQFIDFTSIPEAFSHSYSISAVDSCGNESVYSPVVKTINLLTALSPDTGVIGLHWTPYDDDDFSPDNYYIYKGKTKNSMLQFATVPGNITQYNDLHRNGAMYYQVVVNKPAACAPAVMKAEAGPYTQSLSNIVEYKSSSSFDRATTIAASLFPNPFSEFATLEYELENTSDVMIEYFNSIGEKTGETILNNQMAGTQMLKLNPETCRFNPGINVIKLTAGSKSSIIRCVFAGK